MTKKRTRKQKKKARHQFIIRWEANFSDAKENQAKNKLSEADVKWQNGSNKKDRRFENLNKKIPNYSGRIDNLASIKRDLFKSLSLAALILASELVLYFIWK